MKLSLSILSLGLVVSSSLVGCSAGDGGPADADNNAVGGAPAQDKVPSEQVSGKGSGGSVDGVGGELIEYAPLSVSSVPADGGLGFFFKDDIVVQFSEPMDSASVEAAFSSETLGDVGFWWSPDFKTLKVKPISSLNFNAGLDPEAMEKVYYDFKIEKSALTQQGEALQDDYAVEFAVANRVVFPLDPVTDLSGSVRSEGTVWAHIYAGDSGQGEDLEGNDWWYIGVATFDPSELPGTMVKFESAKLSATQDIINGTPFVSLDGQVDLYNAEFETRDWDSVVEGMGQSPYSAFSTVNEDLKLISSDVSGLVEGDINADRLTQFALRFVLDQDNDDLADNVDFLDASLKVIYYVE